MFKKIIASVVVLSLTATLSACRQADSLDIEVSSTEYVTTTQPEETFFITEPVSYEETTTENFVTTTETTTESTTESTTVTTTVAPVTTRPTTTKKVTTTAKPSTTQKVTTTTTTKPSTTQKATTTTTTKPSTTVVTTKAPATTVPSTSSSYTTIEYDRKEDKSENLSLKYGVFVSRAITTYYKQLADGTEVVVDTRVSEVFTRIGYSAAYADLLPAVKENREKYSDMIAKVLEIINGYRAEKGAAPLKINETLMDTAGARAEEMAWSAVHSHTRPSLKAWSTILKDAGLSSGFAGENIGWGYGTPEDVCLAWKNSKSHYESLINPEFTETGIGIAADPDSTGKLCWVQHFLRP